MLIEFVNHSSLVVLSGEIALLCDFWKDGNAFDDGWQLLCPTTFGYENLAGITHIWFSHEHPDHFSPVNLRQIPESIRANITVLFQLTKDRRVVNFCGKLGFRDVIELAPWQRYDLADDFEISCTPYGADWGDVDSWLCVRTPGSTFLNLNDCEIENPDHLAKILDHTGPIDLLATQFSFASKQGEADDDRWIEAARRYHLQRLRIKVQSLKPHYTLPFASFVFWSHYENRYMNDGLIRVHDACHAIADCGSTPVVMRPDDRWKVGEAWDNDSALAYYKGRYDWLAALPESEFRRHDPVSEKELLDSADAMLEKLRSRANLRQIRCHLALEHSDIRCRPGTATSRRLLDACWSALRGRYERSFIYVDDLQQAYEFSIESGLRPVDRAVEHCDLRLNSAALKYCFSMPFGGETLQVNGRFQRVTGQGWSFLRCTFFLARKLDQEQRLPRHVLLHWLGRKLPVFKLRAT